MDKNKDFIRIDDVFRNMADAEESVKAGAWSEMRALLDRELPLETTIRVASKSKAWRYALPALLALLLGSGLYVWNNHQPATPAANGNFKTAETTTVTANRPNSPVATGGTQASSGNSSATANTRSQSSNQNHSNHSSSTLQKGAAALPAQNTTAAHKNSTRREAATVVRRSRIAGQTPAQNQPQSNGNVMPSVAVPEKTVSPVAHQQQMPPVATSELSEKDANLQPEPVRPIAVPANPVAVQSSLSEIRHEHAFEQIKPESRLLPEENPASAAHLAETHHLEKVGQLDKQDIYQSGDGGLYKEQRDTFKQIELVRKSADRGYTKDLKRPMVPQMDTVSVYKIARLSFVPLSLADIRQLSPAVLAAHVPPVEPEASHLLAAAPAAAGSSSSVDLVPLKEFRVSSHKMNGSIFSRWFQYANGGVSGLFDGTKDWYVALLFGGNMGIGSPNAYGMQAGASFLYALAERWTLVLEMRYQNSNYSNFRFFDNATIYDVTGEKTPLGTQFSGTEYKTQTNYQANRLSRISMPVLLNYNLGRVSLFAGPEFSYYFHLDNTHHETVESSAVSRLSYDNTNPFSDEYYRLDPSTDFKARFALGYAFGLSYDFSRKISVDLRFNQMLWDNSGKYQLDAVRQIYRQPMVELNLGFYLGRKDKVIYIMDRNR